MQVQFSVAVRNAQADALESTIGTTPMLELRTGGLPANCAASATGTALLQQALPSDWLTAASGGTKTKNGTWALTALPGITEAVAGYFRIYQGGTCHIQGDVTDVGGGGAMEIDDVSIAALQSVTVNSFSYTRANA